MSSSLASSAYSAQEDSRDAATRESTTSLTREQKAKLHEMLRVDHSGEIAANTIYLAQSRMFNLLGDKAAGKMFLDMLETEKKHLRVAEQLLHQHRVRPSALNAVWGLAGSFLGASTALFGKAGAMAATEAVETVIGEHYDDQLKLLKSIKEAQSEEIPSLELLAKIVEEFRNDELEHLDTAVEHEAQQAPAHALLSAIIGFGCKGAIEIAKKF